MSGAALVSNIGVFDISPMRAYANPFSKLRCPIFVALHRVEEQSVARNGETVVEKRLPFVMAVDHRFVDFHESVQLYDKLRTVLKEYPDQLNDLQSIADIE